MPEATTYMKWCNKEQMFKYSREQNDCVELTCLKKEGMHL